MQGGGTPAAPQPARPIGEQIRAFLSRAQAERTGLAALGIVAVACATYRTSG